MEKNGYYKNLKWRFHRSKLGEKGFEFSKLTGFEILGWIVIGFELLTLFVLYKLIY
mgnify:FL=1